MATSHARRERRKASRERLLLADINEREYLMSSCRCWPGTPCEDCARDQLLVAALRAELKALRFAPVFSVAS